MAEQNGNMLENRRLSTARAQKNLIGFTKNFEEISIHKDYLNGLTHEEFVSGLDSLASVFGALYAGMINEPQLYAMKDSADAKGLIKNMNFLFLLAQESVLNGSYLEADGKALAAALKSAKVTKPEMYFHIWGLMGFITSGLGKKIETSERITVEFPDSNYLLPALKALADAVGMFSDTSPNRGNTYFELLDCRVLENYPAVEPKTTMAYVLSKLSDKSRSIAEKFDNFISPVAKCEIKGDIGWYWTPTYTLKSTKKVIMSLKLDVEGHDVKLNLANVGKYTELLNGLSEKAMSEVKDGGWDCGDCNPKCESAFSFDLGGKAYRKCRCGSFIFTEPNEADSELLLGLLKRELEFCIQKY